MTPHPESSTGFKHIAIIDTDHHSIQIFQDEGKTQIVVKDHLHITLDGDYHQVPIVIVDSEEYPTKLLVRDTEHAWRNPKTEISIELINPPSPIEE